jgi:hypothetical protein
MLEEKEELDDDSAVEKEIPNARSRTHQSNMVDGCGRRKI